MSEPVLQLRTDPDTGNVIIQGNTFEVEFTPDQAEQFATQLLKRARPREDCFIIPVRR